MEPNWQAGVYADGSDRYISNPNPEIGEEIIIKLRVFSGSGIEKVMLSTLINGEEKVFPMSYSYSRHHFDYYLLSFRIIHPVTKYHYIIIKDKAVFFYNQRGIDEHNVLKRWDFTIISDASFPSWVQDAVFYQIYPDRFYNGYPANDITNGGFIHNGFKSKKKQWHETPSLYEKNGNLDFFGGDLEGIIKKIDYLLDLGINAIYLNPIFRAYSNHKYDCIDYFHVDKHFGGDEALVRLIQALHENKIKLVLDISINHVGKDHPWCQEKPAFFFYDETGQKESWNGFVDLVTLNYHSEELKKIMYISDDSILKKWISQPYNADGWRFDVGQSTGIMKESKLDFCLWREIRKEIKSIKPETYLFTEHWDDCVDYLQGDMWDASMNYYGCTRAVRKFLGDADKFLDYKIGNIALSNSGFIFKKEIEEFYSFIPYGTRALLLNLLSSHDYPRINMTLPREAVLLAPLLQFIFPGTPCIYYGDEINLAGYSEEDSGFRFPMEWNEEFQDRELFDLYQDLISYRKGSEVMKKGGFLFVHVDTEVVSIARFDERKCVLLICANKKRDYDCDILLNAVGYFTKCELIKKVGLCQWDFSKNKITTSFSNMAGVLLELS